MNETTEILIRELSDKLGVYADKIWDVLLLQARVEAISDTVITAIMVIAFIVAFKIVYKNAYDRSKEKCWDEAVTSVAIAFLAFFGVILSICVSYNVPNIITCIVNPEYWALKQIIK
jgi:hypothetical protein